MVFRLSLVALILAVVAFGAIVTRNAAQVEAGIRSVSADAKTLNAAIHDLADAHPTPGQAIASYPTFSTAIQKAVTKLDGSIEDVTENVKKSSAFTGSQTDTITELVAALVSIINDGLREFVAKKPALGKVNPRLAQVAFSDLKDLKAGTDKFGQAVLDKAPVAMREPLQQQLTTIDGSLTNAIENYQLELLSLG